MWSGMRRPALVTASSEDKKSPGWGTRWANRLKELNPWSSSADPVLSTSEDTLSGVLNLRGNPNPRTPTLGFAERWVKKLKGEIPFFSSPDALHPDDSEETNSETRSSQGSLAAEFRP